MRIVIQRVSEASLTVNGIPGDRIGRGFVVLVGAEANDTAEDVDWLCGKLVRLRVFSDDDGRMNLSLADINGEVLVVSQFTLFASTKKGNRPSFIRAARPETAIPLYEAFLDTLSAQLGRPVGRGEFGAHMRVTLSNDGPVTILMDSKQRE